jgi:hypothetical protein
MAQSPQAEWSAAAVTAKLRSQQDMVAGALESLHRSGLLVVSETPDSSSVAASSGSLSVNRAGAICYRYQPRTPVLGQTVSRFATVYRERSHTVLDMIYSRQTSPRSSGGLQAFSNAFRFRSPKKD